MAKLFVVFSIERSNLNPDQRNSLLLEAIAGFDALGFSCTKVEIKARTIEVITNPQTDPARPVYDESDAADFVHREIETAQANNDLVRTTLPPGGIGWDFDIIGHLSSFDPAPKGLYPVGEPEGC